eukprot:m.44523 g.44523  ORF g.44523 m.44523 type:complete len:516 (+) comp10108_c0_seq1:76-1623(+)
MMTMLLAVMFAHGAATSSCSIGPSGDGRKVNPLLLGVNDVLGPIINLSYSDSALYNAIHALHVGALRHPGGTVANYWTMRNGSFVGTNGTGPPGCSGDHYSYCKYEERIQQLPPKTFSAENFAKGLGSQVNLTIHDLNVLTMTTNESLAELQYLHDVGINVTHLELGNEFYIGKNYDWRFPTAHVYAEACIPIVNRARVLFPYVRIAVVAASGVSDWNKNLSKESALLQAVDAVTIHKYGPPAQTAMNQPVDEQQSFVLLQGEIVSAGFAAMLRDVFHEFPHLTIWRTEYNYPSWGVPIPKFFGGQGGVHALYTAGHMLSAFMHAGWEVPFEVLMIHCLAHQPSANWTGITNTLIQVGDNTNDTPSVRIGAVGQIFSHISYIASKYDYMKQNDATAECPTMYLKFSDSNFTCLQSHYFEDIVSGGYAYIILNRCIHPVSVELNTTRSNSKILSSASYINTTESAWAPLPNPINLKPPWKAPLTPSTSACAGNSLESSTLCQLPPLSLTITEHSLS